MADRRRQDAGAEPRIDEVRVCAPGARRLTVGPTGDPMQTREARTLQTEAGVARLRAPLPAQAGAEHDDLRPLLAQRGVVQAESLQRPRREGLDHHIGPINELPGVRTSLLGVEPKRDAEFRRIEVGHELAAVDTGLVVLKRRPQSQYVGPSRRLDMNDGCAVVCHRLGDQRSDADPGKVGDLDARKRAALFAANTIR